VRYIHNVRVTAVDSRR